MQMTILMIVISGASCKGITVALIMCSYVGDRILYFLE